MTSYPLVLLPGNYSIDPFGFVLFLVGCIAALVADIIVINYLSLQGSMTRHTSKVLLYVLCPIFVGVAEAFALTGTPLNRLSLKGVDSVAIAMSAFWLGLLLHDFLEWLNQREWKPAASTRMKTLVLPSLVLFGPVFIMAVALLDILELWGLNAIELIATSGIIGLVLGFALQDTLSNIFAGVGLKADPCFDEGDMITLEDGKICKVDRIGQRVTELYYIKEHSLVFVPNSVIANEAITNITRPSVDLRVSIPIGIAYEEKEKLDEAGIKSVIELLRRITREHPHVLLGNIEEKIKILEQETSVPQKESNKWVVEKLKKEITLEEAISNMLGGARKLCDHIQGQDKRQWKKEFQELNLNEIKESMMEWSRILEPDTDEVEKYERKKAAEKRNKELEELWRGVMKSIRRSKTSEQALNLVWSFERSIRKEYKSKPESWKDPEVTFSDFGPSSIDLVLEFHVDDITLCHYRQKELVIADLANAIQRNFADEGISIPFPQTDIHFKDQLSFKART
jgi:small-conductance mechanosensitive channel